MRERYRPDQVTWHRIAWMLAAVITIATAALFSYWLTSLVLP
jgi:hypothetical protein